MTVTPVASPGSLPTNLDTITPLSNPSHSSLHNQTNDAVNQLVARVETLENIIAGLTAPQGSIEQARLNPTVWTRYGDVVADGALLLPVLWNMTGRTVTFEAAKATILTPPEADVEIDIVVGTTFSGPDFDSAVQTSVLKAPVRVPAGEAFSATLGAGDFAGQHPVGSYVVAYVKTVGGGAPGVDLVVQLNRNL